MGTTTDESVSVDFSTPGATCSTCGHDDRKGEWTPLLGITKLLRVKAPRVACAAVGSDNYTVWSDVPCGCKDPFHSPLTQR